MLTLEFQTNLGLLQNGLTALSTDMNVHGVQGRGYANPQCIVEGWVRVVTKAKYQKHMSEMGLVG